MLIKIFRKLDGSGYEVGVIEHPNEKDYTGKYINLLVLHCKNQDEVWISHDILEQQSQREKEIAPYRDSARSSGRNKTCAVAPAKKTAGVAHPKLK